MRHIEGPWFWVARDGWYATVGGKQVKLGVRGASNRSLAVEAWHKLMANTSTSNNPPDTSTRATTTDDPVSTTVGEVVDAFLADIKTRLKASTIRIYGEHLAGTTAKSVAGLGRIEHFFRHPGNSINLGLYLFL